MNCTACKTDLSAKAPVNILVSAETKSPFCDPACFAKYLEKHPSDSPLALSAVLGYVPPPPDPG